jgi:hypothetical protein
MSYRVLVDDNFHSMDEARHFEHGEYASLDDAIAAARTIVDEYLDAAWRPGITADELFTSYTTFGECPFVLADDVDAGAFSAWDYARERCVQLTRER